jgi:hypothetical protein
MYTHTSPLLPNSPHPPLPRAIASKQCGSERRLPTSQHKAEKNFNFNNVRAVMILGDGLEGSMVVCGMAFGRDSEGAFLFCLPFFLPPLILLRVSLGNRHGNAACCGSICTRRYALQVRCPGSERARTRRSTGTTCISSPAPLAGSRCPRAP